MLSAHVEPDGTQGPWILATPIIRLVKGRLSTQVVSHEMHHAATALYGASLPDDAQLADHLTHHNEPFAHLYSDLLRALVDRLYALGYYDRT